MTIICQWSHGYPESSRFRCFENRQHKWTRDGEGALLSHIRDGPFTYHGDLSAGRPHIFYLQFKPKARAQRARLGSWLYLRGHHCYAARGGQVAIQYIWKLDLCWELLQFQSRNQTWCVCIRRVWEPHKYVAIAGGWGWGGARGRGTRKPRKYFLQQWGGQREPNLTLAWERKLGAPQKTGSCLHWTMLVSMTKELLQAPRQSIRSGESCKTEGGSENWKGSTNGSVNSPMVKTTFL